MTDALVKGRTQQQSPSINADGAYNAIRATRSGELFTADWKVNLAMRGLCYNVSVGGIAAGGDIAMITGGGAGTTIDSDQPEMIVQTPATHFHVPLAFKCAVNIDAGTTDLDEANIILFADTTPAAILATATATGETPHPLLDGGAASVSTCFSAVTADIVDPTADMVLDFATFSANQVTAASSFGASLRMDFEPMFPIFLKGPVAVVACWGGTIATPGICSYYWAEIPLSQIE